MVIVLIELGVTAWLLGSLAGSASRAPSASDPSAPPAEQIALPPCADGEPAQPPAAASVAVAGTINVAETVGAHGMTYLPANRTLAFGQPAASRVELVEYTLFGDRAGASALPVASADGLTTSPSRESPLVVLDAPGRSLQLVGRGRAAEATSNPVDLRGTGVGHASAVDLDPSVNEVVLIDSESDLILRFGFRQLSRGSQYVAELTGGCQLRLAVLREARSVSLAIRAADGHLFVAGEDGAALHELNREGHPLAVYDMTAVGLSTVRGMTFGPTADPADDPAAVQLYVLDGLKKGGRIVQLSFTTPPTPAPPTDVPGSVVARMDTAGLDPISSDPGGVAYDPIGERILVTDSDIDEIRPEDGNTVFSIGKDGTWLGLGSPGGVTEVTDIAVDAAGGRWFLSDDRLRIVVEIQLGQDGLFDTLDDRISRFSTEAFASTDPEGVAYGQNSIFIADGSSSEIYRLTPGPDGVFGGIDASSDDTVTHFDTAALGVSDPEGIAYDPQRGTLYLRGRDQKEPIVEVGTDGTLVSRIFLPEEMLISPGGIGLVPALDGSDSLSLLVADRGEDNAASATPIDGHLLEVRVDWLAGRSLTASPADPRPPPTESP